MTANMALISFLTFWIWDHREVLAEVHTSRRDPMPPGHLFEERCFMSPSDFSRCCDPRLGPRGDRSCWGGLFQFSSCCVPPLELSIPVSAHKDMCDKHLDWAATNLPRVQSLPQWPDLAQTREYEFPYPFSTNRSIMTYLCCGQYFKSHDTRELCWPDLEALWPAASDGARSTQDFESSLKENFMFSQTMVLCCEGRLQRVLASNASQDLQERLVRHVRSRVEHFEPDVLRAAINASSWHYPFSPAGGPWDAFHPSRSMGRNTLGVGTCCCRLQVRNGRVRPITCPRDREGFLHGFAAMFTMSYYYALSVTQALGFYLPDFDAYLNWGDFHANEAVALPVFTQATNFHTISSLLLPDHKVLSTKYPAERAMKYAIESKGHPWELKKNKLLWRGSNTRPSAPYCAALVYAHALVHNSPRPDNVLQSLGLVGVPSCGSDWRDPRFGRNLVTKLDHPLVDAKWSSSNFATMAEQAESKWLLSLDGWANDFRVTWIPFTGSLLVRQSSPVRDWLDISGMRAWRDYVPVHANLSDIPAVLTWLMENDAEAEKIARSGFKFIERRASFSGAVEYLYWLFNEYALEMKAASS